MNASMRRRIFGNDHMITKEEQKKQEQQHDELKELAGALLRGELLPERPRSTSVYYV